MPLAGEGEEGVQTHWVRLSHPGKEGTPFAQHGWALRALCRWNKSDRERQIRVAPPVCGETKQTWNQTTDWRLGRAGKLLQTASAGTSGPCLSAGCSCAPRVLDLPSQFWGKGILSPPRVAAF